MQVSEREDSAAKQTREVTFKCKYCGQVKPLEEMRILSRFFPLVVTCRQCEKRMQ